jgi:hypothetical protein
MKQRKTVLNKEPLPPQKKVASSRSWLNFELVEPGSTKANGRVTKTCLSQVFNYKLGCFDDVHVLIYVDMRPHL